MNTKLELLPCPFCGNDNVRVMSAWTISEQSRDDYAVHCSLNNNGCGATGRYSVETTAAVNAWNHRA